MRHAARSTCEPAADGAGAPGLVLGSAAAMFAVAVALVPTLGTDLIPQLAQDRFEMTMKLPPGTPLSQKPMRWCVRCRTSTKATRASRLSMASAAAAPGWMPIRPSRREHRQAHRRDRARRGARHRARETEALRETMQRYPAAQVKFGRPEIFSFSTPLEDRTARSGPGRDRSRRPQAGRTAERIGSLRRREVDGGSRAFRRSRSASTRSAPRRWA
jgi:HAE1 family hydrophobic/amphiphilic exporter-1